ncbi:MAG: IS91 family transposase [Bacteroidales bacterium]|nr:IS91 family transposase [Candidatus Cloacimonadota bacterium]MDD2278349.1 IS91 family transposase [Bacteroidales bacterium]
MQRPPFELADVIHRFGARFVERCKPNAFQVGTLSALARCRTSALGGHVERCSCCKKERISYNSCRNRHCPKCQLSNQALWVDDCIANTLRCKHFHLVFTVPEELNALSMLDSRAFYSRMFESVWDVLRTFGYSHFGVESGAICVLHTWGQNLVLHPHIHCIVPAAGLNLHGELKHTGKNGRYLYPVKQLSSAFRTSLLKRLKADLKKANLLDTYKPTLEKTRAKEWVVHCEPALGKAERVIRYLGQYIHRVAISNQRILNIDDDNVTFQYKDYADCEKSKVMTISGVEFLRRFCLHILPKRFVKIRRYGIYGNRYKRQMRRAFGADDSLPPETRKERLQRVLGSDPLQCPYCKKGQMVRVDVLPRIRSPSATSFRLLEKVLA